MNEGTVTLSGIVTNSAPAGEYDRRITLITRERGKITAFVRGARRPKSRMIAATNIFCFGTFTAYEGRSAYNVVRADISNYFRELPEDIKRTYYGCYFLELSNYFCRENEDCTAQINLLYSALRALCRKTPGAGLIRRIFELKSLALFGVAPNISECAECKGSDNLMFFNPRRHGVMCARCGNIPGSIRINPSVLYTLSFIISAPVGKLFSFTVSDSVLVILGQCADSYLELFVDRELSTKVFLD